ncbi:unnamed protein product, partial [Rotaria sp. Silwood1]
MLFMNGNGFGVQPYDE